MLFTYFAQQWSRPHYQYFPFVLGAFLWLLWRNGRQARPRAEDDAKNHRLAVIVLLAVSWLLLAQSFLSNSPLLTLVSAILLVAAGFLQIDARWHLPYLWGIWALLWLVVRPPLNRDQLLIEWLQGKSSRLSSIFLDWGRVEHLMDGNVLILPEKQFFVDEACSGIVSVLSIIACSVIYGVWRNRAPVHVVLLALAGVGWATFMNVIRITTIAIVFDRWGLDWSTGMSHEILGLVVFTFIFLALVSTDYLLLAVLAPIKQRGGESVGQPIHFGRRVVDFWDWLGRFGAPRTTSSSGNELSEASHGWKFSAQRSPGLAPLAAFAALAAAQLTIPYWFQTPAVAKVNTIERALALDADVLPSALAGLQRAGFTEQERASDDIFGHHSRVYNFKDEQGNDYMVSCDFPFGPNWHDLTVCYRGIGWQLREQAVRPGGPEKEKPWSLVESGFAKPDGSAAWLVYSVFDEFGASIDPPTRSLFSEIWRSLEKKRRYAQQTRLFQVQVWTTSAGTVREGQREAAKKLLLEARERIRLAVTKEGRLVAGDADSAADPVVARSMAE
jgi:exosortase